MTDAKNGLKLSIKEIAQLVGGKTAGDESKTVTGVAPLDQASSDDLSFLSDAKHAKYLENSRAGILILKNGTELPGRTAVFVDDPKLAFAKIMQRLAQSLRETGGIHPTAAIAKDAQVGPGVSIGAHAVIEPGASIGGNTSIGALCYVGRRTSVGKDCLIHAQVTLREDVRVGNSVIIHSGTVIGSDGFGYATDPKTGIHHKIPQLGGVEIQDHVEIGANVAVDRATLPREKTVIGQGTKIDNLVQIAHNVQIGEGCIIVSQAGVAGSSRLGRFVVLGGQVGVVGHITIGDGAQVASQSGIPNDVPAGSIVLGSPARNIREERRIEAIIGRLPKIYEDFRKMKKKLLPDSE